MELEEQEVKALQEEVATLQYRSSTPLPSSALCSLLPPQKGSPHHRTTWCHQRLLRLPLRTPQLATRGSSTSSDIMLPPIPVTNH